MKVVCIDNYSINVVGLFPLTLGKIYDVVESFDFPYGGLYYIIDDNGTTNWYTSDVLMSLDNHRDSKLNQLGI